MRLLSRRARHFNALRWMGGLCGLLNRAKFLSQYLTCAPFRLLSKRGVGGGRPLSKPTPIPLNWSNRNPFKPAAGTVLHHNRLAINYLTALQGIPSPFLVEMHQILQYLKHLHPLQSTAVLLFSTITAWLSITQQLCEEWHPRMVLSHNNSLIVHIAIWTTSQLQKQNFKIQNFKLGTRNVCYFITYNCDDRPAWCNSWTGQ